MVTLAPAGDQVSEEREDLSVLRVAARVSLNLQLPSLLAARFCNLTSLRRVEQCGAGRFVLVKPGMELSELGSTRTTPVANAAEQHEPLAVDIEC